MAASRAAYNKEVINGMNYYCVVYLSPGRMHYRFWCSAANARQAKKLCKESLGISDEDIVEVYRED